MADDAPAIGTPRTPSQPTPGLMNLGFETVESMAADRSGNGEKPGDLIGRYRLLEIIGEGGFGIVWRAEQTAPIRRELALKAIKPGMDSQEIIARFDAERQALALMEHPNIAGVLDAGTTTNGRPYFVMELVRGAPITTYCDTRKLDILERLSLFIAVCHAVQHAHQKAVLHRDLKPSNILVAEVDGKPVPKVIDFGIAKALGGTGDDRVIANLPRTQEGAVIGTPRYMSPEQAGSVPDVDTRSDIYSLGVILFELLTGQTPLHQESVKPMMLNDLLYMVREQEAVRPSNLLQHVTESTRRIAMARRSEPMKLARSIRGDLDWIVMKALEKDRERRYDSAADLAQDVQRHLRQEPVSAAAPTWVYRVSKFNRRHRAAVITATLVSVALMGATIISLREAEHATQAEHNTELALAGSKANFDKARTAVDSFLNSVTDDPRLAEADLHDLRKHLLETAIPFYEQWSVQKSNDPEIITDQCRALLRLGRVYNKIGNLPKADESLKDALRLLEKLPEGLRRDRERMQVESQSLLELGAVQQKAGRMKEAEASYRSAVTITHTLADIFGDDPSFAGDLAVSELNLGIVLDRTADELGDGHALSTVTGEAERSFRRSLAIAERWQVKYPGQAQGRRALVTSEYCLGHFLAGDGRLAEGEAAIRKALEAQEQLMRTYPAKEAYRGSMAQMLCELGSVLYKEKHEAEAERAIRQALATLLELATRQPNVQEYQNSLASGHQFLGAVLDETGRGKEAVPELRQAQTMLERLCATSPNSPLYRSELAATYDCLAGIEWRDRPSDGEAQFREAIAFEEKLLTDFPQIPESHVVLGKTMNRLSFFLKGAGRLQEAHSLAQEALRHEEAALAAKPTSNGYRMLVQEQRETIISLPVADTDHEVVAREAQAVAGQDLGDGERLLVAARQSAQAIVQARAANHLPAAGWDAVTEKYAQQAVQYLAKAIQQGCASLGDIGSSAAFVCLGQRPDFQALVPKAEAVLAGPVPPDDFFTKCPLRFIYDYTHEDPGLRVWNRQGAIWIETQPSGKRSISVFTGRLILDGIPGSVFRRTNDANLSAFVPDKGTGAKLKLQLRKDPKGGWGRFAEMKDVE
ncbi:MAG: pknB [Verrucomicrobiaceae bacterium]|nr:pknB [Verrucomicrobiaceae bacterium]